MYVWKCRIEDEVNYEGRVCGKIIAINKAENAIKVLTGDGSIWITQSSTSPDNPLENEIEFGSIRVTLR
jgi:methionyl-tRNA formyltransferase